MFVFESLLSAPRFPGDYYTLHLTGQQVDFLCGVMQGFRKNMPKALEVSHIAILELLVIHEKCISMLASGSEVEQAKANEYLVQVRTQIRARKA